MGRALPAQDTCGGRWSPDHDSEQGEEAPPPPKLPSATDQAQQAQANCG